MKAIFLIALISTATFSPFASAACQHYEYSELKAMKRNDLEFAYCEAGLESKKAKIQGDTAQKLEGINRSQARLNISDSIANDRSAANAESAMDQCSNEMERIGKLLISRKINLGKLRQECHLDDQD